jgi:DNA replication protein DnaC
MWIDFNKYIRKVRNSFEDDADYSYDDIISAAANVSFLLFDDFGSRQGGQLTHFQMTVVEDVIGERYNNRRATIFTTNLDQEGIAEQFGDRVLSRVLRMAYWIDMGGINLRNRTA